jgi:hypothetical protein
MTTKAEKLARIMADIYMHPEDDQLEVLARHLPASAIEKAREIDRRVMKELAEEGYPAPEEDIS